ncbi:MAG TPA: DUF1080 domain-containing protein [Pirellulales bacterium]|nr:DUF1080 domain-containing protein [Pirellulales bacterium]
MPRSRNLSFSRIAAVLACLGLAAWAVAEEYQSGKVWPKPNVVTPGESGGPPSDAIVLFGGKDMSAWVGGEKWLVKDGVATVHGGGVTSKQSFGDCQLHVEWASPKEVKGEGQGRGNSGIYLQNRYEVQILDSYGNETYYDGQAGAIYKQWPPLVNACRKPGEWQTYEILFEGPRFDKNGKLAKPAYVTVLHNGVLIQNHAELQGSTAWDKAPEYEAHPPKQPISIQHHGNPVRFRNLWIREL